MQKNGIRKYEILSPAGQLDSVYAAVSNGANSIYLGMQSLNARRNAKNFDEEQIETAVRYCKLNGVKVYLTLNTVAFDSEREQVIDCIQKACELALDAFIVQDLGVARLCKQYAPDIALHGSTQMSIHTKAGAQLLKDWGFKRVVLAREMSLSEIAEVAQVDIELESFVQGALCMSVSGQCYMSGMLGGRSANRGMCAQPCRLPFSSGQPGQCDLSLKDLSAITRLDQLLEAGVLSLKIEGRMKRPEYVAAATAACRDAISGSTPDVDTLRAVFSRGGFTSDYLDGKPSPEMFGVRGKEDVISASSKLLKQLENTYQKQVVRVDISLSFVMKAQERCALCIADCDGNLISITGAVPEPAINVALNEEKLKQSLFKFGGTPFGVTESEFDIEDGLSIPMSELNRMRREASEQLIMLRSTIHPKRFCPLFEDNLQSDVQQYTELRGEFDRFDQIPFDKIDMFAFIALDLDHLVSNCDKLGKIKSDHLFNKLMVKPPRGMFGRENEILKKIQHLKDKGLKHVLVQNLAHIELGKQAGLVMHGGFSLNITNTDSIKQLQDFGLLDCVLSPELTLGQIKGIGGAMLKGALVYAHLPLMLTRNCPINNTKTCAQCRSEATLIDRKDIEFRVLCANGCSEIYNSSPLWMADRLGEISNISFGVLKFTYESPVEVQNAMKNYIQKVKLNNNITRGLYYRGVE